MKRITGGGLDPDLFYYWPANHPRVETLDAFLEVFTVLGFVVCDAKDHEDGFEKIAFYVDNMGLPVHAARQLPTGRWTSKLGLMEDIEHELTGLEGDNYGRVAVILKRPLPLVENPNGN